MRRGWLLFRNWSAGGWAMRDVTRRYWKRRFWIGSLIVKVGFRFFFFLILRTSSIVRDLQYRYSFFYFLSEEESLLLLMDYYDFCWNIFLFHIQWDICLMNVHFTCKKWWFKYNYDYIICLQICNFYTILYNILSKFLLI